MLTQNQSIDPTFYYGDYEIIYYFHSLLGVRKICLSLLKKCDYFLEEKQEWKTLISLFLIFLVAILFGFWQLICIADILTFKVLRHNKKHVLSLFKRPRQRNFGYPSYHHFTKLPKRLRDDKEVVLAAVRNDGEILFKLNKQFQQDRDLVIAALSNNPNIIRFLDHEFRDDKEIIKLIFKINRNLVKYASASARKDKDFLENELGLDEIELFRHGHYDIRRTKDVYVPALKKSPSLCNLFRSNTLLKLDFSSLPIKSREVIYQSYERRSKEKDLFFLAKTKQHFLS